MNRFEPSLLDKLTRNGERRPNTYAGESLYLTLEALKQSVARDLETLLNSRRMLNEPLLTNYPLARQSVLAYGLGDFSAMSLASSQDRLRICQALEEAINHHEPRLKQVATRLRSNELPGKGLHIHISAVLVVNPVREPVDFDALMEPTTQQYTVQNARRRAA